MTDYRRPGWVSAEQGREWIEQWSQILDVDTVCLFGGEPLLNRDIETWIDLVRQAWPLATIKVITNGVYLDRRNILPKLFEVGNAVYQVSLHWRSGPIFDKVKQNLIKQLHDYSGWSVIDQNRSDLIMSMTRESLTVQLAVFGEFIKSYQGYGQSMMPWNSNDPEKSHSICGSPANPILYKNRIYKCGPLGNLRDTLIMHQLDQHPNWQPYLTAGYAPTDDLTELIDNFGKPNPACAMCSSNKSIAEIQHYRPGAVHEKGITWQL